MLPRLALRVKERPRDAPDVDFDECFDFREPVDVAAFRGLEAPRRRPRDDRERERERERVRLRPLLWDTLLLLDFTLRRLDTLRPPFDR